MKKQYHHGNLREALVEAGLKLIQEQGVQALTLREIGARVGVSRMAAYRHFSDKDDLLGAICEAGFARFADALEQAKRNADYTFAARLSSMAHAYVRFAAEHPAYYAAMFGSGTGAKPRSVPSGARAFGVLEETIREGQESGDVREGDTVTLARCVWAQVHGISTLAIDQDPNLMEYSSDLILAGLAPRKAKSDPEIAKIAGSLKTRTVKTRP